MTLPLMPKATAVWLVDNTALTFAQIAAFCGMHTLEVQAIADGEVATGIVGADPVAGGQLTQAEIQRCEQDPTATLHLAKSDLPSVEERRKGARYTPVSRRQDRPDGIAWLLRHHPELSDAQIARLLGTTKPTIQAVRDRSHWNIQNIKPQNPVMLRLCSEAELEKAVTQARARSGYNTPEPVAHDAFPAEILEEEKAREPEPTQQDDTDGSAAALAAGWAATRPRTRTEDELPDPEALFRKRDPEDDDHQ